MTSRIRKKVGAFAVAVVITLVSGACTGDEADASQRARMLANGTLTLAATGWAETGTVSSAGGAAAGSRADTRVTIHKKKAGVGPPIISGTVQSKRPLRCAKGREVVVFRRVGPRDPKTDQRVSLDRASLRGDRYVWFTRPPRLLFPHLGRLYAHVSRTEFCRADMSKLVHFSIPG